MIVRLGQRFGIFCKSRTIALLTFNYVFINYIQLINFALMNPFFIFRPYRLAGGAWFTNKNRKWENVCYNLLIFPLN